MGQNKAQREAAARAKKASASLPAVGPNPGQINGDTGKVNEQPKPAAATPAPAAAAAPTQPSKQQAMLDKLREGWTAKGVDLSKLEAKPDGKFMLVTVAEGWPVIQLGPTGGIVLPQIRSYARAWDAAMDGLAVFQKQQARDSKKQQATAPAQPAAEKQTATA
jgi:hypothetical protein